MYRRYLTVLLGLCAVLLAYSVSTAVWVRPRSGDLTRLGGYSENEFGWNRVEERFSPPLAEPGRQDSDYAIVVLGDSFSLPTTPNRQTQQGSFWPDFLANDTGLSVGVFDVAKTSVEQYLEGPAYRLHAPRLVILELSERTLRRRLVGPAGCSSPGQWVDTPPDQMPEPLLPGGSWRPQAARSIEAAAEQIADRLKKTILHSLLGYDSTRVLRLPLARSDLFTSRRPAELLIYADDLGKTDWSADDWSVMHCRLQRYQHDLMANGRTGFLFVMAPDKSSAYAADLPAGPWQIEVAGQLAEPPGLSMPRLDLALRAAIAAGTRDVYLPNDTHWSTTGSRIAAQTVLEYLRANGGDPVLAGTAETTARR